MAKDIEPVAPGKATAAGRLCNFVTASSTLLPAHRLWLDKTVIPAIRNSPNPWVDIFGYASRLGDAGYNKSLSDARCKAVVIYIKAAAPRVSFPQQFGFGESRSTGGVQDNDGYWRAVELYVYAFGKPPGPGPKPRPPEPTIIDEWFVTKFSGHSESVIIMLGYSAMTGQITFTRADGTSYTGAIGLFGLSAGISLDLGKIPGLTKLFARFPALAQFLGGGLTGPLANDLLKWISRPGILQRIIALTPGGMKLYSLLKDILLGGSVAPDSDWFPSKAIGLVFPFRPPLNKLSFSGICMCYALTGSAAFGSGGTYILFFGYRGKLTDGDFSLSHFNGCAIIAAGGAAIQFPGLSAAGTLYIGEIT
ncbi:MAG: hypothetical protein QHC89_06080 [Bosea sp. (in: a-proteobacteria)]|nr:hypothetical protein [Bosea sp. (in: a-proteobacteria)]